jgi:23S rRNA U2552 (ribose-2'-O)-methylase RlmE/FtsJ
VARRANPLKAYFRRNRSGRLIHTLMHYFDIYHSHFNRFRRRRITVVEFGVQNGGSLDMWRHYFGRKARIIGVDIDPNCKALERPGTEILIGDQEDRDFLRQLRDHVGPIDVLIEDGGHTMGQQIPRSRSSGRASRAGASSSSRTCIRAIGVNTAAA